MLAHVLGGRGMERVPFGGEQYAPDALLHEALAPRDSLAAEEPARVAAHG